MRICMRLTVSLLAFIMIIPSVTYGDKAPKDFTIDKIVGHKKGLPQQVQSMLYPFGKLVTRWQEKKTAEMRSFQCCLLR